MQFAKDRSAEWPRAIRYPIELKTIWSVLRAPVTSVPTGNTLTRGNSSQARRVADLLDPESPYAVLTWRRKAKKAFWVDLR